MQRAGEIGDGGSGSGFGGTGSRPRLMRSMIQRPRGASGQSPAGDGPEGGALEAGGRGTDVHAGGGAQAHPDAGRSAAAPSRPRLGLDRARISGRTVDSVIAALQPIIRS